uniref:Galectin domain-containing protein n=1 Tax=Anabas testudineus TaxID=64144 RepID=A0AAQ6IU98_ANATE
MSVINYLQNWICVSAGGGINRNMLVKVLWKLTLHVDARFNYFDDIRKVIFSSCKGGTWGKWSYGQSFPFEEGKEFEVCVCVCHIYSDPSCVSTVLNPLDSFVDCCGFDVLLLQSEQYLILLLLLKRN